MAGISCPEKQVLQHLGRGILIGTTSSLTEASLEKHGKAAREAPRGVTDTANEPARAVSRRRPLT